MPELPDLEYVISRLRAEVIGQRITAARVREPIVLRVAVPGDLPGLLPGRTLSGVRRRGHFVDFDLEGKLQLVIHPMLAGRFKVSEAGAKDEGSLCFALALADGRELRYLDDKKMGKAYLIPHGGEAQVPGLKNQGVEVLSEAFTRERFGALLAKRRDQVRPFLMDKSALSAMGNAYADEVLFAARIHPKTWCKQLTPAQADALYAAIGQVLRAAVAEVAQRQAPLDEKVRDFLQVRGRAGEPCPRCGAKIRTVRVVDGDACFCPECQPATRSLFIDWRQKAAANAEPASGSTPPPVAPAPDSAPSPPEKRPRARGRAARGR
jgi:formamidopyrimidine-DNA glycosylase